MISLKAAVPLGLVLGFCALTSAPAHAAPPTAKAAQAESDDAVVLPGRVASAIRRTQRSLDNAEEHVDEGEYKQAVTSLRGVRRSRAVLPNTYAKSMSGTA